ncbi:hypothetical protein [Streptomyces lunaelactis]|uniref:hypothetical protein n=1 Tax=Streptomyces lunaelactis TaxID=1535768 RepID=UPI0015844EB3|nr:hypothetical protein [Streptomyces lunaelactis]NUK01774.1 hypothetical protein [Streptomyces lunaelactis]NUK14990.1 hypothetical protein [Streptomyces lunaelactis]
MSVDQAFTEWVETVRPVTQYALKRESDLLSGYVLITDGGDRHGALEWVFYSEATADDPLDRLAAIGVIPHPEAGSADFEFWFGGRSGDRYVRRLASYFYIEHKSMDWDTIADGLKDAVLQANSVNEEDLNAFIPALSW